MKSTGGFGIASKLINEDLSNQLKNKLSLKADLLKEIEHKKQQVEAELDRIKLEIREINMRHREKDGKNQSAQSSMDPAGTKLHIKLSEIVMRPRKQQTSPIKKGRVGTVAVEEEKEESEIKLFYSLTDSSDQFFNSVQKAPVRQAYALEVQ